MALNRTDMQTRLVLLASTVARTVTEARVLVDNSTECSGLGYDQAACSAMSGLVTQLATMGMELVERIEALDGHDIAEADFDFLQSRGLLIIESAQSIGQLRNTETLRTTFNAVMQDLADHVGTVFFIVGKAAGGATKGLLFGLGPVGLLVVAALIFVYAKGKAV